MAQCQPGISYIVLRLLTSDGKSRPGQPCVQKHSRHHSCWQQQRMEQNQAAQTCAKVQPGHQLNQKTDVARESAANSVLLHKVAPWHQGQSRELEPKSPGAVHFLAQDAGSTSLHSAFFSPKLQTPISLGVMLNSFSCLCYTEHALGQEVTALPMH